MFSDPASLKRFLVFVFGAGFVALQPLLAKYGIPTPDDAQIGIFAALVAGYIGQSAAKSISAAKTAGVVDAAKVTTTAQADAVIAAALAEKPLNKALDNDKTPPAGTVKP
jgi:hypothetical protein